MNNFLSQLKFKVAGPDDVDFIIECIIEAEKSGTEKINTCNIFSISEKEYKEALKNILLEDVPEYDFWLSGFLIAELNGKPVSAQGAWFEGGEGISSSNCRATMLMEFLPREKFILDSKIANLTRGMSIERENGTVQLEHAYTIPELRRRGFHLQTVLEIMKRNFERHPEAKKIQTMPLSGSYKTLNACNKMGFTKVMERKVSDPDVLNYFAFEGKFLMELTKEQLDIALKLYKLEVNA